MEQPVGENDKIDRIMRALEIASLSGFMVSLGGIQAACFGLCNICRECAPVRRLTISRRGPPAFLAMLCPDIFPTKFETASRVVPPRRVLKVEVRDRRWSPAADDRYRQLKEEGEPDRNGPADLRLVDVRWPAGTKEIYLPSVKGGIDRVAWPVGLKVLGFYGFTERPAEGVFNSPLDKSRFPSGLREIFMGNAFNQSIQGVAWPSGLERLSLPGFNKFLQGVRWPAGLKSLEFMAPSEILLRQKVCNASDLSRSGRFNQPLGSALPAGLETLWLSDNFDQSLKHIVWPSGLTSLGVGFDFLSARFAADPWPPGLRKLFTVSKLVNQDIPAGCEVVSMIADKKEEDHDVDSLDLYLYGDGDVPLWDPWDDGAFW